MIKVILIDIDNTLLNFDAFVQKTLEDGFTKFQLGKFDADVYTIFEEENGKIWRELEKKEITFDELQKQRFNRFFSRMHISFDGVQFEKYFRASLYNSAILEPGAKDMVQYLHSKYELYIASNGPYLQQKHRVELAGLLMYFKDAFISEDIGASKPAYEFFEEAMRRINHDRAVKIQKNEVLMIGDSLSSDISGSKAFGIHTCFYNKTQRNDIPSFVEHVVDSLEKVKTIV